MIPIVAHRTCPLDGPENSLFGIRKAAEYGADVVEIDVRRTLEGVPVLMHDWSPRRTTGFPGPVWLYPWALLRRLHLERTNERVPSLAQALDELPASLMIAIEIKDESTGRAVLREVRARSLEPRVLVWSYREVAVRHFAREAPEIETSLLRDPTDPPGLTRFLSDAVAFGARGISAHHAAVNPQFVGEAHDRGLKVYSWIRELDSVPRKVAAGLDGIVTDQPKEVREVLSRVDAGQVQLA
jgi:glycerophosphoryl diester phosphodiesterase